MTSRDRRRIIKLVPYVFVILFLLHAPVSRGRVGKRPGPVGQ